MLASRENLPLLAELLAEQQHLDTPVARFASAHESGAAARISALAAQLIPISKPKPGEQYAFEVDLDSCTGCKSCVAACHSLNGLDENETWRDVGVLVSASRARPFTQTITSACHHCADPACLNGCPVLAYEKDSVTGIVRHLDDQCIGCSYCILKCPYDVPKFSNRLGIVRKCDMCHSRLAAGEAPACAQACPTHAIKIIIVGSKAATESPRKTGAPRPETGNRKPETENCGDIRNWRPETGHGQTGWESKAKRTGLPKRFLESSHPNSDPTPVSDVSGLTSPVSGLAPVSGFRSPVSGFATPVSGFATPAFLPTTVDRSYTQPTTRYISKRILPDDLVAGDGGTLQVQPPHWPLIVMLTLMPIAVGFACAAALFPQRPFTSGLNSTAFAACAIGATGLAASVFHLGKPLRAWRIFLGWRKSWLSREALIFGTWLPLAVVALFERTLLLPSALVAVAGLVCSSMIYVDTRRHFWRAAQTVPRFFGTAALAGIAPFAPRFAAGLLIAKMAWEWRTVYDQTISARLQRGPLGRAVLVRDGFGLVSLVLLAAFPGTAALLALFVGEFAERYLFFRAVDAPKMPGMPA